MKIKYIDKRFTSKTLELIDLANQIITEYQGQGYDLTLRQLYYQLVARDHIPNQQSEYKRLGGIVGNARLSGLISWQAIVDRTRSLHDIATWSSPESIISSARYSYRIDLWADQDYRLEVWVEKDALRGVIRSICDRLNIPDFSCRGYSSLSEMWAAGNRLKHCREENKTPVIIHLGDHDPSGIDMTRDIIQRLEMFSGCHEGSDFHIIRAALNYDQIEQYGPPPNPAKLTDSRATCYIVEYGHSSWELDALEPAVLEQLISDLVAQYRDEERYAARLEQQSKEQNQLRQIERNYKEIVTHL